MSGRPRFVRERGKPKPKIPITPTLLRKKIGEVEFQIIRLQLEIQKLRNHVRVSRAIDLLNRLQNQKRQMYFLLNEMKMRGEVKAEIEAKKLEDWNKNKCIKCEQAKYNDEDICPECGDKREDKDE